MHINNKPSSKTLAVYIIVRILVLWPCQQWRDNLILGDYTPTYIRLNWLVHVQEKFSSIHYNKIKQDHVYWHSKQTSVATEKKLLSQPIKKVCWFDKEIWFKLNPHRVINIYWMSFLVTGMFEASRNWLGYI